MSQGQLAAILTSRAARRRFLAGANGSMGAAWVDQLEITARIVAHKRQEALTRWFPATIAVCEAVPALRGALERCYAEPLPLHGPDRRLRCADALAIALQAAGADAALGRWASELLCLEFEIVRLTYHPPPEALAPLTATRRGDAGAAAPPRLRLAAGAAVLSFPFDVLTLWEHPAEAAPVLLSPAGRRALERPSAAVLVRRRELRPVHVVRLGPGAAQMLSACRDRPRTEEALLESLPADRRPAGRDAVRRAVANGLLVAS